MEVMAQHLQLMVKHKRRKQFFGTQDDAFFSKNQEEENVISPTPATGKRLARPFQGKDKEKKQKTGNALLIQEAVARMASSANEFVSKREGKYSIDQVMELVIACAAGYGSNEHYVASELL